MRALLAGLLAALVVAAPSSGAQPKVLYYEVDFAGSGSYVVDYSKDRLRKGLTSAIGVDGQESHTWSWEIRSLAKRIGQKPAVLDRKAHAAFAQAR